MSDRTEIEPGSDNAIPEVGRFDGTSPNGDVVLTVSGVPPQNQKTLTRILLAVIGSLVLALTSVTLALWSQKQTADAFQTQLRCRATDAVVVDFKTADELTALGVSESTTLAALAAVAKGDTVSLNNILKTVPHDTAALTAAADALQAAAQARQEGLTTCK